MVKFVILKSMPELDKKDRFHIESRYESGYGSIETNRVQIYYGSSRYDNGSGLNVDLSRLNPLQLEAGLIVSWSGWERVWVWPESSLGLCLVVSAYCNICWKFFLRLQKHFIDHCQIIYQLITCEPLYLCILSLFKSIIKTYLWLMWKFLVVVTSSNGAFHHIDWIYLNSVGGHTWSGVHFLCPCICFCIITGISFGAVLLAIIKSIFLVSWIGELLRVLFWWEPSHILWCELTTGAHLRLSQSWERWDGMYET